MRLSSPHRPHGRRISGRSSPAQRCSHAQLSKGGAVAFSRNVHSFLNISLLHFPNEFLQTQLDKQLINTKRLRQQRLDALKQLQDKAAELGVHPALAGVPDGPAVSTAELCLTLPNGEGKSDSQNTNDGKTDSGADALTHLFRACYICKVRYAVLGTRRGWLRSC